MLRRYTAYPQHLMQSHNYQACTVLVFISKQTPSPNSRGQKLVKNPSPDPTPTQLFVLCADCNGLHWITMTVNYNGLQWIQITMNYNYNDYNGCYNGQQLWWITMTMDYKLQWPTNYNDYNGCYNGLQLIWTTMTTDYNGLQHQLQWLTSMK